MKKIVLFFLGCIVLLGGFLRVYRIATNPPGLYLDEVSIGLNAYDILTTGKDQYAVAYPLVFKAFGEYKMPVYIYLTAGSMALFGKNEFAIRFPSALFGTLTIIVLFFVMRFILSDSPKPQKYADTISLLCALFLACSSWHLQFSRGGFEATVALFFYTLSLLLYLYFLKSKNMVLIFCAAITLAITFYTYDGYKLLVPCSFLAGLGIGIVQKPRRTKLIVGAIVFLFLCIPLSIFTLTTNGFARFQQASAFAHLSYAPLWQKYLADIVIFCKNYLSYFSVTYLFRFGDQINRHQVQDFGLLYLWQLPFIVAGFYFLSRTSSKMLRFLLFSLFIVGPITPALTIPSPHSLRFLYAVIPYTCLTGLGFYELLLRKSKWVQVVIFMTVFVASIEFVYYLDYYYVHYPKDALIDWGGACKQVAQQIAKENTTYKKVIIDTDIGCVTEYFSFYIPNIPVRYVATTSALLESNHTTLLITSEKGSAVPASPVVTILLPNLNQDTFAKLWSL